VTIFTLAPSFVCCNLFLDFLTLFFGVSVSLFPYDDSLRKIRFDPFKLEFRIPCKFFLQGFLRGRQRRPLHAHSESFFKLRLILG